MKISRNTILTMMIVFITSSLSAKQVGQKTGTVQPVTSIQPITSVQPKQPPIQLQSSIKESSYARALRIIRTEMRSDQVLKDNTFTQYFINFVRDSVQGSEYADVFAKALLQAGATLHVTFDGDNAIDFTIIDDINNEVDRQMRLFFAKPVSKPGKSVEQSRPMHVGMYLVPTDAKALRQYDLCPLFSQKQLAFNQAEQVLAKELKGQGYSEEDIAKFLGKVAPHYSVFNEQYRLESGDIGLGFENKDVGINVPCVVVLGAYGNWNRTLIQLKSLDQFELSERTGLSPALCAGHSLNNGRLIRKYAFTGQVQCLSDLHNINDSAQFLRNLKIGDWLNASVVRDNIAKLGQDLGVDGVDVSAIETISLFDSGLDKKSGFGVFDPQEFAYVQKVKKNIREGLKQDKYVHIMIVGNEETVEEALGHYFCFAIIKKGNDIQYVVLDTIPSAYHLQAGSHERDRLMFVIDNIEKGSSLINVVNLNVKFVEKTF